MFGHDRCRDGAVPETAGAIFRRSVGACRAERTPTLGGRLCARIASGRRAEIGGTHGPTIARWERAGHAAIRRTESLGLEAGMGAVGTANGPGAGTGPDLGHR